MIPIGTVKTRNCQGVARREFLRLGSAGFAGLSLLGLLRTRQARGDQQPPVRERSCIFIYLAGGPSHLETFDPKPQAPSRIKGPWGAVPTSVPGTIVSELLPELARQADKYALVRSLHHTNSLHQPWPMLTGTFPHRTTHGAAVTFLKRHTSPTGLPPFVNLGPKLSIGSGVLGGRYDPLELADPTRGEEALQEYVLTRGLNPDRLHDRESLLSQIDTFRRQLEQSPAFRAQDSLFQQAIDILTSSRVRAAFDLAREPAGRRDRFGANSFGQSCLLARRLIEAGTRFVQINWYNREDGFAVGWDVHGDDNAGLVRMEQQLCPRFDQGLSALLEDLHERGLLDSTLVCATGEFGRTPSVSRLAGRDHWPYCFSALLAGGGTRPGTVVGASDAHGAYPAARPVSPADFSATLFHLLGVDPTLDDRLRPSVFEGGPIEEVCA